MKLKLSFVSKLFNFIFLNLLLVIGFCWFAYQGQKVYKELNAAKAINKSNDEKYGFNGASIESQEEFYKMIDKAGLIINNKNVEYLPFEENPDFINASYSFSLTGRYLHFIKYLETLQKKNMLYKIDSLKLKVKSEGKISIKMKLESLYEIN